MVRPLSLDKFRTGVTKSIQGLSLGFRDPDTFISTGNYTLNYLISSDFFRGVPLGKVTMFAGDSGSGKSFIVSGNIARNAQDIGVFPIIIDTEAALDEDWLRKLGVDTSPDKMLRVSMSMIDDVAKFISEFVKDFKSQYSGVPREEQQKILFIIDSLGMLLTNTDVNQFEAGDLKGDMGRKPKALNALVRNCVNMFAELNIGLVCTNHSYASQDMFDPDDKISGGQGFIFASSIVVATKKLKLKEDEDGNKIGEVRGIRSMCKVMKSRYNKPFEAVEIKIPWDHGMNPYSGLFELFEKKGFIAKVGNKYRWTAQNGEEITRFRKQYDAELLDRMMNEFPVWEAKRNDVNKGDDSPDALDEKEAAE